jgi:hypothetical protein
MHASATRMASLHANARDMDVDCEGAARASKIVILHKERMVYQSKLQKIIYEIRQAWWDVKDDIGENLAVLVGLAVCVLICAGFWVAVVAVLQLAKKHWGLE